MGRAFGGGCARDGWEGGAEEVAEQVVAGGLGMVGG